MLEARVHQMLKCEQRGLRFEIPETFKFADPDRPVAGRFVIPGVTHDDDPGLTFAEAESRMDVAWIPPSKSLASRNISLKSMASVRGHMVDIRQNQVLIFESILEYFFTNVLLAQKQIVKVEDQPGELEYELDGQRAWHTLDYRSTDHSNRRVAYQVKPSEMLKPDRTLEKLNALKAIHVPTFALDIIAVTERQITRGKALNAIDINNARKERRQEDCDRVLDVVRGIGRPIEMWRLQLRMGDPGTVWNALLCLHYDRLINISRPGERFHDNCLVQARWVQ
ncbi:hypothetical protein [Rhizobium sp. NXC24]|uniref:hypothetical protein n=1 Tax=Rhizobium sp. NXC24 TaxID=2048897 RepID=UPI000CDF3D70|nr:hypothetical protein [Rhizobium sp. NXC24]AVA21284.1 hypothetical protein NXC24_CH01633 [Rhizobium sp. NXC24]